jgi:hypothetical protein
MKITNFSAATQHPADLPSSSQAKQHGKDYNARAQEIHGMSIFIRQQQLIDRTKKSLFSSTAHAKLPAHCEATMSFSMSCWTMRKKNGQTAKRSA